MSDWRLNGQEEYLSNKTFCKIVFPAFWKTAYKDKNAFFQKIERYAKKHVEETNCGHEFLEGEKIQHFWHGLILKSPTAGPDNSVFSILHSAFACNFAGKSESHFLNYK